MYTVLKKKIRRHGWTYYIVHDSERITMTHMEPYIRVVLFLGLFIVIALGERIFPRRNVSEPKRLRWFNNLVIGTLCIRFLIPVLPVGFALICSQKGWGILNNYTLPFAAKVIIAIIVLDFIIYLQHVMHHSDRDFDVTTALQASLEDTSDEYRW